MQNKNLKKLYKRVDKCRFCQAMGNKLQHIHGFGALGPRFMLVLVNPTYRNLSSEPEYKGPRFPFIGVRQFWRVLADGGLIDKKTAYNLPPRTEWEGRHTKLAQNELLRNKLFLTNVVKCCYPHGKYPKKEVVKDGLIKLAEEIKIVRPKAIIAFSIFVYKLLTGKNIKMSSLDKGLPKAISEKISGLKIPVLPCYFPIGRGNPKKAIKILKKYACASYSHMDDNSKYK